MNGFNHSHHHHHHHHHQQQLNPAADFNQNIYDSHYPAAPDLLNMFPLLLLPNSSITFSHSAQKSPTFLASLGLLGEVNASGDVTASYDPLLPLNLPPLLRELFHSLAHGGGVYSLGGPRNGSVFGNGIDGSGNVLSKSGAAGEGLPGADGRAQYFARVIKTHDLYKSLPASCTNKMDPSLCLYPENFVGGINAPVFILESAFDNNQIRYRIVPGVGGTMAWIDCLRNLTSCNSTELEILRDFRAIFIETLLKLDHSPSRGMFVHSFFRHGHLLSRDGWTCSSVYGNNILGHKTIGQAIADWYFDRSSFEMIDARHDIPINVFPTRNLNIYETTYIRLD